VVHIGPRRTEFISANWKRDGQFAYYEMSKPLTMKLCGEFLVDVREKDEVSASGLLPNAVRIPLGEVRDRMEELPRNRKILVYCQKGGGVIWPPAH